MNFETAMLHSNCTRPELTGFYEAEWAQYFLRVLQPSSNSTIKNACSFNRAYTIASIAHYLFLLLRANA
ncbi:MAG: hypothetical protein ABIJ59_09630 [Pseudomonadota bacterium]